MIISDNLFFRLAKKKEPQPVSYRYVDRKKPIECGCGGKLVYMEGDLHKSGEMIPCPNAFCRGGLIYKERKPVYRIPYNK